MQPEEESTTVGKPESQSETSGVVDISEPSGYKSSDNGEVKQNEDLMGEGTQNEDSMGTTIEKKLEKEPIKMTKNELKSALKIRDMQTTGIKSVLLARLLSTIRHDNSVADSAVEKNEKNNVADSKNTREAQINEVGAQKKDNPSKIDIKCAEDSNNGNLDLIGDNDLSEYDGKIIMNKQEAKKQKRKATFNPSGVDDINPKRMKVGDLRSCLAARGLSTKGSKPILVEALANALEKETPDKECAEILKPSEQNQDLRIIPEGQDANVETQVEIANKQGQDANIETPVEMANKEVDCNKNIKQGQDANIETSVEMANKPVDCNKNISTGSLKPKKVKSGREIKILSNGQYADMIEQLPNGGYDFDESPVLMMNASNLKNGVNFHIPKTVLPDPAIPKDVLRKLLLKSGLKRNEIAICCGLAAEKTFQKHKDGKDGKGTQFLRDIDPDFVTSEGLPNITKHKTKKNERDAFTLSFPHATYVTANEIVATILRQTRSNDLRNVLRDICTKNKDIEEGHNRAVIAAINQAMEEDLNNQNDDENLNYLSDEDSSVSEEESRHEDNPIESDEHRRLRIKMVAILSDMESISLSELYEQVLANEEESEVNEGDLEQVVDVILDLGIAAYDKKSRKLEYVGIGGKSKQSRKLEEDPDEK